MKTFPIKKKSDDACENHISPKCSETDCNGKPYKSQSAQNAKYDVSDHQDYPTTNGTQKDIEQFIKKPCNDSECGTRQKGLNLRHLNSLDSFFPFPNLMQLTSPTAEKFPPFYACNSRNTEFFLVFQSENTVFNFLHIRLYSANGRNMQAMHDFTAFESLRRKSLRTVRQDRYRAYFPNSAAEQNRRPKSRQAKALPEIREAHAPKPLRFHTAGRNRWNRPFRRPILRASTPCARASSAC